MTYSRRAIVGMMAGLATCPAAVGAQSYQVQAGDILRIEVVEDETLNRTVLVAPDGRISVPQAGSLRAAGRSVESIAQLLTDRLASGFNTPPNVFVAVEQVALEDDEDELDTINIFVIGEVERPGQIEVDAGTTLLQAFAAMGGFSTFAATKRVQLRRTDPQTKQATVRTINYDAILEGQVQNTNLRMRDGDVIVVPARRLFE